MRPELYNYVATTKPEGLPHDAVCHLTFHPWVPCWLRWLAAKLFIPHWVWTH